MAGIKMTNKKLMIGIPTKNHPVYIQVYLARVLHDAKDYGIDLHIYDSSDNNLTEEIVKRKIQNSYDNLYYHRCIVDDISTPPAEKIKNILVGSGYEYVWLCGDGVMLNLDNVMPYVDQEMKKNRDLIIFGNFDSTYGYTEYTAPIKLMAEQWKSLSLYGGTIYRGNLFSEDEWAKLFPVYTDNIQLAGIFDLFARKPLNAVSVRTAFFTGNPYKEEATWISGGNLLQTVVDHIPSAVDKLPEMYSSVKAQTGRSFSELRGMLLPPNLWWLRATGNITPQKVIKYRKQLKKISDTKWVFFMGASLVPQKLAEKLSNIFSYA